MGRNFLGEFEQRVLLAILRCDAKAYPIDIRREVPRASGHEPSRGAFYTTLDRLEAKKLVRWTAESGDARPRRLAATPLHRHARRRDGAARLAQGAARALARPRRDPYRVMTHRDSTGIGRSGIRASSTASCGLDPEARVAARQTRRKHSRRSARGVFVLIPIPSRRRCGTGSRPSARASLRRQPLAAARLTYPRSNPMWFELSSDLQDGVPQLQARIRDLRADRAHAGVRDRRGDHRIRVCRPRAVPRPAGGR